ncbi:MAG: 2OG-Fe(II) oxygenase [Anaerolinea sp.]|nr:2OG-Fe(II) oxygenase [Anaerolinea sp.]
MNKLLALMDKVETSGTFSVGGTLPSIPPGLKVKGVGHVALPLLEQQAKALIKFSQQSPFGYGEETIHDTNVRKSWQIAAEDFELTNPQWEEALREAVAQIGKQLGLDDCKIEFEQYKLLIYEEGGLFAAHRDTEKIPNMFATLVVNLPSEHEGGELIVSHGGQSHRYSFADSDGFHPAFAAFYADCYHEVKPVTSGYRINLIYNLSIVDRARKPLLSEQSKVIEDIGRAIQKWKQESSENPILIYLLEHSYTEQNISLSNLKHGDFAKASVLLNAAEQNGCQAFLCLATYYRTSYGETAYYGRYSSRYDLDEDDFEEYDVDEEEVYAHSFVSAAGEKIDVKKLRLDEDDLLAKTPLREGPGRGYSISEATGNEGATKDLWYHRGAIIIWPKDREFDLVTRMDLDYGLHVLKTSLQKQNLADDGYRQKIIQLADHLLENLPSYRKDEISKEIMLIGEIALLKKFLRKQMNQYSLSQVDDQIVRRIVERFGWQHFEEDISAYLTPQRGALGWLNALLLAGVSLSGAGQSIMTRWVNELWQPSLAYGLTKEAVANLVQMVSLLKIETLTDEIIAFLSGQEQKEFLTATYGPALVSSLKALKGRDYDQIIMKKFSEDVRQRIKVDFPAPPEPPKDWSREGRLNCGCEFCTEVNKFLPDPERSEISFYKTLKRNLLHIEAKVEESQVELDIEIRHAPPKFEGTCRKNQSRYDSKRKLFDSAQQIVKELVA